MTGLTSNENTNSRPIVLTFIAPAKRCNQHCPKCYLTQVRNEPVTNFDLDSDDYSKFVHDFHRHGYTIKTLSFQGYEVTMPDSWKYVESVFRVGKDLDIKRSFITNGMLLHRYADRIEYFDPARISISIDGADKQTNDRHRGLRGSFDVTIKSVQRFLNKAPNFADRLAVISVLYGKENFGSLMRMPKLLRSIHIKKWGIALEIERDADGRLGYRTQSEETVEALRQLQEAASEEEIDFFVGDEFGLLKNDEDSQLRICRIPQTLDFCRLLPSGHVYWGEDSMRVAANIDDDAKWNPKEDAVKFLQSRRW